MTILFANLNSSALRLAAYDTSTSDLTVVFRNGNAYQYFDVYQRYFEGLMCSDSAGQFYNANIRGFYDSIRVNAADVYDLIRDEQCHIFQSSFLSYATYDSDSQVATVVMRGNRNYAYRLHPDAWHSFITAESAGQYFNNYIARLAERV